MKTFHPNLDILPPAQQALWQQLAATPRSFVLYGGTAIALRLGHRQSVDFDFFSHQSFNPSTLYENISYLQNTEVMHREQDTLTCFVPVPNTDQAIKVSFFGGLPQKAILMPEKAIDNGLKVAPLLDLFGMKCATVVDRLQKKDYVDIHAILQKTELRLSDGIAAAQAIYGKQYHPLMTLKALSCFQGGNLATLGREIQQNLQHAVAGTNITKLQRLPTLGVIGQASVQERDGGRTLCL